MSKENYFITPQATVELLGLTQRASTRTRSADGSTFILNRGDMLAVMPEPISVPEPDPCATEDALPATEAMQPPEGFRFHTDLIIHQSISVKSYEEIKIILRTKEYGGKEE